MCGHGGAAGVEVIWNLRAEKQLNSFEFTFHVITGLNE